MTRIAIVGGGSWGTALAIVLSGAHERHEISLWVRTAEIAAAIRERRVNEIYLPGHELPVGVKVTHDVREAVQDASILIGAIPAAHARSVYSAVLPHTPRNAAIVSATKGLEPESHARMSEVVTQILSAERSPRFAVLSGPSFAAEAAAGQPTAVVVASSNHQLAGDLQKAFAGPSFRLYTNDDVLGVELAGAMKNVIAIAAGACQGIGLGANSLAALITRGLAEMKRLAQALGAKRDTLSGLAGLGDLVLTCTGALSRNRHVGIELSKGRALSDILAGMKMVAEGVGTASALLALAQASGVELPIIEQVTAILRDGKSPEEAIRTIMERSLKRE